MSTVSDPKPQGYHATAAELRRIADAIESLPYEPFVTFYISPAPNGSDAEKVAAVDAVAMAILGEPGMPQRMSSGTWHHKAGRTAAGINLSIHAAITGPPDEKDARIAELELQLAEARGEAASCLYVLRNGVRCNEPIEQMLGEWVHSGDFVEAAEDHYAVGPS
jgi:hypothetical protein